MKKPKPEKRQQDKALEAFTRIAALLAKYPRAKRERVLRAFTEILK